MSSGEIRSKLRLIDSYFTEEGSVDTLKCLVIKGDPEVLELVKSLQALELLGETSEQGGDLNPCLEQLKALAAKAAANGPPILFEGSLQKKRKRGGGWYQKRYFILRNNRLVYCKKNFDTLNVQGSVPITPDCFVREKDPNLFEFELGSTSGVMLLRASSGEKWQAWIRVLHDCIFASGRSRQSFVIPDTGIFHFV